MIPGSELPSSSRSGIVPRSLSFHRQASVASDHGEFLIPPSSQSAYDVPPASSDSNTGKPPQSNNF